MYEILTKPTGDHCKCVTGPGTDTKPIGSMVESSLKKNTVESVLPVAKTLPLA